MEQYLDKESKRYGDIVTMIEAYSKDNMWNSPDNDIQRSDMMKFNVLHVFKQFIGDEPVFIYLCPAQGIPYQSIGNRLAVYFEYLAASMNAGMHFLSPTIIYHNHEDLLPSLTLPKVVLNPNPTTNRSAAIQILSSVEIDEYPLANLNAMWKNYIPLITLHINNGLNNLVQQMFGTSKPLVEIKRFQLYIPGKIDSILPTKWTQEDVRDHIIEALNNDNSLSTNIALENDTVPLFSDHVIHFRCSDVLLGSRDGTFYGLLNFYTYVTLIPKYVQSIYIISEPKNHGRFSPYCGKLVIGLAYFLNFFYPQANIAVHQGRMEEAMLMINQAKGTVICAPSTFCFWPQLASSAKAYHKRGVIEHNGVKMRDNFIWLDRPKTASFDSVNMTSPDAVTGMIEVLTYFGPDY